MNFKTLYFLLLISFITIEKNGNAQTESIVHFKNNIHVKAGGAGGYGSLNYERTIPLPKLFSISGRIGVSTIRIYDFSSAFNPDLLFPITVSGFYGKTHKVHLGFGQSFANVVRANPKDGSSKRETNLHTHFTIGYRYQKSGGRLILGINYTPIIEFQEYYRHWGGVTVGFAF